MIINGSLDPLPPKPISVKKRSPADDDLSSPDAMYSRWVKPFVKKPYQKYNAAWWHRFVNTVNDIQRQMSSQKRRIRSNKVLHQLSLQFSLYELLVLYHLLVNNRTTDWQLTVNDANAALFSLATHGAPHTIQMDDLGCQITHHEKVVGRLHHTIDNRLIDKIHGHYNDLSILWNPTWMRHKKIITDIRLGVGHFIADITMSTPTPTAQWLFNGTAETMDIPINESIQLNQKLYLNKKSIQLSTYTIQTLQWYIPWSYYPVLGVYAIHRRPHATKHSGYYPAPPVSPPADLEPRIPLDRP